MHPRLACLATRKMPLNQVVRRVVLESEWALQYSPIFGKPWHQEASLEITKRLASGAVDAFGLYCDQPPIMAKVATHIPKEFWRSAVIDVRGSLFTIDQGSWAYQDGHAPVPMVKDVSIPVGDVNRFWPKTNAVNAAIKRLVADDLENQRMALLQSQAERNA